MSCIIDNFISVNNNHVFIFPCDLPTVDAAESQLAELDGSPPQVAGSVAGPQHQAPGSGKSLTKRLQFAHQLDDVSLTFCGTFSNR